MEGGKSRSSGRRYNSRATDTKGGPIPGRRFSRRFAKLGFILVTFPFAAVAFYFSAALVLGLFPVNRSYKNDPDGIVVYVRTNGVHADLISPIHALDVDWAERLPIEELHPIAGLTDYLAFGWGDRGIYLGTATLRDLRLKTAVVALTGLDTSVLHVEAVPIPVLGRETRHLQLSGAQYRRLAAFLARGFRRNETGAVIVVPDAHYDRHDAFFEAEGRYSVLMTCNEWARRGLSVAGVRVPAWSPFDKALMYQLPLDDAS